MHQLKWKNKYIYLFDLMNGTEDEGPGVPTFSGAG